MSPTQPHRELNGGDKFLCVNGTTVYLLWQREYFEPYWYARINGIHTELGQLGGSDREGYTWKPAPAKLARELLERFR